MPSCGQIRALEGALESLRKGAFFVENGDAEAAENSEKNRRERRPQFGKIGYKISTVDDGGLALHSCLGLIEFHAREAAAECCVTATQQLVEMLRSTMPASAGNNVRAAVVYTGGTTSDAALLMAPLISGLRAE